MYLLNYKYLFILDMYCDCMEEERRQSLKVFRAPKRLSQESIKLPNIIDTKVEPLFKFSDELSNVPFCKKFKSKDKCSEFPKKREKKVSSKKSYTEQRLRREAVRRYLIELIVRPELFEDGINSGDKDINKYYYYIQNGIDTIHVTPLEEKIIANIMILIPKEFRHRFLEFVNDLLKEVENEFIVTMKKSIIEFAMINPQERDISQVLI